MNELYAFVAEYWQMVITAIVILVVVYRWGHFEGRFQGRAEVQDEWLSHLKHQTSYMRDVE